MATTDPNEEKVILSLDELMAAASGNTSTDASSESDREQESGGAAFDVLASIGFQAEVAPSFDTVLSDSPLREAESAVGSPAESPFDILSSLGLAQESASKEGQAPESASAKESQFGFDLVSALGYTPDSTEASADAVPDSALGTDVLEAFQPIPDLGIESLVVTKSPRAPHVEIPSEAKDGKAVKNDKAIKDVSTTTSGSLSNVQIKTEESVDRPTEEQKPKRSRFADIPFDRSSQRAAKQESQSAAGAPKTDQTTRLERTDQATSQNIAASTGTSGSPVVGESFGKSQAEVNKTAGAVTPTEKIQATPTSQAIAKTPTVEQSRTAQAASPAGDQKNQAAQTRSATQVQQQVQQQAQQQVQQQKEPTSQPSKAEQTVPRVGGMEAQPKPTAERDLKGQEAKKAAASDSSKAQTRNDSCVAQSQPQDSSRASQSDSPRTSSSETPKPRADAGSVFTQIPVSAHHSAANQGNSRGETDKPIDGAKAAKSPKPKPATTPASKIYSGEVDPTADEKPASPTKPLVPGHAKKGGLSRTQLKVIGSILVVIALALAGCAGYLFVSSTDILKPATSEVKEPQSVNSGSEEGKPTNGPSNVTYRYTVSGPEGVLCTATEVAEFDATNTLTKSIITTELPDEDLAKQFLTSTRNDFGDSFVEGSVEGSKVIVIIDETNQRVEKEAYTALLMANAASCEVIG